MTPERWRKINDLFHAALACNTAERSAFLDQACLDDPGLRQEVESLMESYNQNG
jgi:hypothetical protein